MAKHYLQLSKILKKLLYDRRMNPSDLAREVNLPTPTVHRLVTGKSTRPYRSSLEPIADYFSLNVEQLLGEKPLSGWGDKHAIISSENSIKTIPIIQWEEINDINEARNKSTKYIATIGNISNVCLALIMNDYSMEPLFPKGTILIFDPHKKPVDRSYILIKLKDKEIPIFRQILIDVDHKYLKPLNPDLKTYKMRLLGEDDIILACLFESRINHEVDKIHSATEDD